VVNNDNELWHHLPQLSLRHVVPPALWSSTPPNLLVTKQKKRRLATEAEEKKGKTFYIRETK